jgi:hypothetical protein
VLRALGFLIIIVAIVDKNFSAGDDSVSRVLRRK